MNRRQRKKLFDQSKTIWRVKDPELWKQLLIEFGDEKDNWIANLKPGDIVNDCRFKNQRIVKIIQHPYDSTLILEDGWECSSIYCCNPPITEEEFGFMDSPVKNDRYRCEE